jgi:methylmalonyl-CoA mutase C-terminal domain/subunit
MGRLSRTARVLNARRGGDVLVTVGGTIPAEDIPELMRLGVGGVFTPGATTETIIEFIRAAVGQRA